MTLDNRPEDTPDISSTNELALALRAGEKPEREFRVGMEHEKIGLLEDTLEPLPYSGPRSIEAILEMLIDRLGFSPVMEQGRDLIALTKQGTAVSLEPGGQLELSGAILENNHQTCRELTEHRDITRSLGKELGVVWLGVGHTPFARRDELDWVPKTRYGIMRRYLSGQGDRALDMMLRTGTVQANFDWSDEADMVLKMRAASSVTSLVSAIYANSSIVEGKTTGWVSERQRIWRSVDPDRSGLLTFVFDEDFGYERYVEWALDVPMFFIRREGRYVQSVTGMPFRAFLKHGCDGHRARFSDWEDHLTTLFPEVRIKAYLEVRGADCCDRELNCALPALWKGLLYHRPAAEAACELTAHWTPSEREQAIVAVARQGLEAEVAGQSILDLAHEMVDISRDGLIAQRALNAVGHDETGYLDPVYEVIENGRSPGKVAAELWDGSMRKDPKKLIGHYRF